jgi:hypothetical protein
MSGAQKKLNMSAVDVDGGGNEPVPPLPSQYVPPKEKKKLKRQAEAAAVAREKGGKKDVKMSNESPVQTVAEASPSNVAASDEEDRREQ